MSLLTLSNCATKESASVVKGPYKNTKEVQVGGLANTWEIAKAFVKAKRKEPVPIKEIPVNNIDVSELMQQNNDAVFKLGHSSILMRLSGNLILLDPVFSERASPVQWVGPKRFHQPPIAIKDLPTIDAVVISHDHYDHLDKGSVKTLKSKVKKFLVPQSIGKYLRDWGVEDNKIVELSWWQEAEFNDIKFVATPTQHFSGRGLFDKNETLWASWVIQGSHSNVFFSGDSGYFDGFKQIGDLYGPFDVTLVETGAYNALWKDIHMTPEESVQAHIDLQGKVMIPIHNSTFDLALHDWHEPLDRVTAESSKRHVDIVTPVFGDEVSIERPFLAHKRWWQSLAEEASLETELVITE